MLEVNHTPSFRTDSRLDEKVKTSLIFDTCRLLNINPDDRLRYHSKKSAVSQIRLYGSTFNSTGSERKRTRSILKDDSEAALWKKYLVHEATNLGGFTLIYPTDEYHGQPNSDRQDMYRLLLAAAANLHALGVGDGPLGQIGCGSTYSLKDEIDHIISLTVMPTFPLPLLQSNQSLHGQEGSSTPPVLTCPAASASSLLDAPYRGVESDISEDEKTVDRGIDRAIDRGFSLSQSRLPVSLHTHALPHPQSQPHAHTHTHTHIHTNSVLDKVEEDYRRGEIGTSFNGTNSIFGVSTGDKFPKNFTVTDRIELRNAFGKLTFNDWMNDKSNSRGNNQQITSTSSVNRSYIQKGTSIRVREEGESESANAISGPTTARQTDVCYSQINALSACLISTDGLDRVRSASHPQPYESSTKSIMSDRPRSANNMRDVPADMQAEISKHTLFASVDNEAHTSLFNDILMKLPVSPAPPHERSSPTKRYRKFLYLSDCHKSKTCFPILFLLFYFA